MTFGVLGVGCLAVGLVTQLRWSALRMWGLFVTVLPPFSSAVVLLDSFYAVYVERAFCPFYGQIVPLGLGRAEGLWLWLCRLLGFHFKL